MIYLFIYLSFDCDLGWAQQVSLLFFTCMSGPELGWQLWLAGNLAHLPGNLFRQELGFFTWCLRALRASFPGGQVPYASAYQVSVYIILAKDPLAKASPISRPSVSVEETAQGQWILESVVLWGPSVQQSSTVIVYFTGELSSWDLEQCGSRIHVKTTRQIASDSMFQLFISKCND